MSVNQFLLYENASGYALFQKTEGEVIASGKSVEEAVASYESFSAMTKLVAFQAFGTSEEAVAELQAIAAGEASDVLVNFLELNLPKAKSKKSSYQLGVFDPALGQSLSGKGIVCNHGQNIKELLRGCILHFSKFESSIKESDLDKARCGLSHCYSRTVMQLDPNRQDKPIMNTIALLDGLDKNINTFAMRVREWYAWHFPELAKIVNDNIIYARVAKVIRIRDNFDVNDQANKEKLTEVVGGSEEIMEEVIKALKVSMGQDIAEMDMLNIDNFARNVIELAEMRTRYCEYLKNKMNVVAPNLCALIGEHVGARLISHAGSLTNLAKYPASTVQILGAVKALFRALKTKGNTPKYGLLYHSTFIGRAKDKNKGRISRYLANKCSIASRIDCFTDTNTRLYGEAMKNQVEDRLSFLTEGKQPKKNIDVMKKTLEEVTAEKETKKAEAKAEKKSKKSKKSDAAEEEVVAEVAIAVEGEEKTAKKDKKDKKRKAEEMEGETAAAVEEEPTKKKKKKVAAE